MRKELFKHMNYDFNLFSISNETEYAIYRSQTFKSQGFGQGMDAVWSLSNDFAVRENNTIRVIKS